jgi:hypothetical protein
VTAWTPREITQESLSSQLVLPDLGSLSGLVHLHPCAFVNKHEKQNRDQSREDAKAHCEPGHGRAALSLDNENLTTRLLIGNPSYGSMKWQSREEHPAQNRIYCIHRGQLPERNPAMPVSLTALRQPRRDCKARRRPPDYRILPLFCPWPWSRCGSGPWCRLQTSWRRVRITDGDTRMTPTETRLRGFAFPPQVLVENTSCNLRCVHCCHQEMVRPRRHMSRWL